VIPAESPRPKLLLVDDNRALVENLQEILLEAGYQVACAGTCAEALRLAADGFDVALVDLKLPDGDGTVLAPGLKELSPTSEVVLLTGFATLESAVAAVRAGACAYLVKPCATHELLVTVEQALRQVRLHEEKQALAHKAQMAEKLAAVGTLTAGLSHEIRNPLNAALLQLTVLERRIQRLAGDLHGPLLEPLVLVKDEIRRLDHILEDFLQFARPREFIPRPVDLATVVSRVLDLLGGEAERRAIRLEREEERLRQVLVNLMLNAVEATPAGGLVRVRCQPEPAEPGRGERGGGVAVMIEDTGPGVPAAGRDRIFEPFYTTKASGSGLGLSIVHAIVSQHGGTISVESAPGGGARFLLRLPRLA
jgi:two-component system sensor histidine kinase HydH